MNKKKRLKKKRRDRMGDEEGEKEEEKKRREGRRERANVKLTKRWDKNTAKERGQISQPCTKEGGQHNNRREGRSNGVA